MSNDDNELIAHIMDGNTEQFRALVDRHKDNLYRHCFYITRDEDVAEDMAQDAFIRAYTKLGSYDGRKASFRTWLFMIATRLCLDYLRKPASKSVLLEIDDITPDTTIDLPHMAAEKNEVYGAVLKLSPKYRTAILLYYWHGYSYEQISEYMQSPVGSIRSWIHRAKKQLKEGLS